MKNKQKILLYICNIVLIILTVVNIISYDIKPTTVEIQAFGSQDGKYISYLVKKSSNTLEKIEIEEQDEETKSEVVEIVNDNIVTIPKSEDKKIDIAPVIEQPQENNTVSQPKKEEVKEEVVLETLFGSLVGYGPDCAGCTSNKTASGKYIGEGNIYYEDATYGKVRIVAGDYSYPFGTIVRISNVDFFNDEPFYAVVLDRGGDIGKNGKHLFDLLFASEKDAYPMGKEINIKYEIMRLGY